MGDNSRKFHVIIEQDEDGCFVGEAPQLKACYSQGKTVDELLANMREVIALCLEEEAGAKGNCHLPGDCRLN